MDPEKMVVLAHQGGRLQGVLFNPLVGCLFARGVYTDDNIVSALLSVGIEKTRGELSEI